MVLIVFLSDHKNYLGIQIVRFYFKCSKCSTELTMKTDPRISNYTVEAVASRNFEPWRGKDKEIDKEMKKRETEELGDAMKSLENRTLDSKREMYIMSALDEMKSMKAGVVKDNTLEEDELEEKVEKVMTELATETVPQLPVAATKV